MKKVFLFLLTALLLAAPLTVSAAAYSFSGGLLTPGLSLLAAADGMIRSSLVGTEVTFSRSDFEKAVGCRLDSVVITALPPSSDGTLYFGSAPVIANQLIGAAALSSLRFVPSAACGSSSFRFKAAGEYSIECALKFTDTVNTAPTAAPTAAEAAAFPDSVWTQQDITVYGTLNGSDPDGDAVIFEVTKAPQHGILEVISPSVGDYRYTPFDGYVGKDTFCYTVRDEWGNYAEDAVVSVEVARAAADLVFADMDGHWAYNAALVMAAEDAMQVESVDGQLYFRPDERISREDFLVTVMKALGAGDIEPTATVFADNAAITPDATGYIDRAYRLGVIRGSYENGMLCFKPGDSITRAEAAVILNAILGAETPDAVPVFADSSAVPAWAQGSLYALTASGYFKGTGAGQLSPNEVLDRAQTAEILLTIRQKLGMLR